MCGRCALFLLCVLKVVSLIDRPWLRGWSYLSTVFVLVRGIVVDHVLESGDGVGVVG